MHGDVGIAMALHAAIAAKGQTGREHMLHLSNETLDALGTAVFYGKTDVFKALFHAKCPSIYADPDDRNPSLLPLRKLSRYNPLPHMTRHAVPLMSFRRFRSLLHIALHSNKADMVQTGRLLQFLHNAISPQHFPTFLLHHYPIIDASLTCVLQ